jgi:hypothetical protein
MADPNGLCENWIRDVSFYKNQRQVLCQVVQYMEAMRDTKLRKIKLHVYKDGRVKLR